MPPFAKQAARRIQWPIATHHQLPGSRQFTRVDPFIHPVEIAVLAAAQPTRYAKAIEARKAGANTLLVARQRKRPRIRLQQLGHDGPRRRTALAAKIQRETGTPEGPAER